MKNKFLLFVSFLFIGIMAQAQIVFTDPIVTTSWAAGTTHDIIIENSGSAINDAEATIYLSIDGGEWVNLNLSPLWSLNTGSNTISWPIISTTTASTNCKLAINSYWGFNPSYPYHTESNVFTISPAPPSITVTTPSLNNFWQIGTTHNINWTSTNILQDVIIQYSTTGAAPWTNIITIPAANIVNGPNSYPWLITAPIIGIEPNSKVKVVTQDGDVFGTSPAFTLSETPQFVFTAPTTTTMPQWIAGETKQILINNQGAYCNLGGAYIYLSTDNGITWSNYDDLNLSINQLNAGSNTIDWTINPTTTASTYCKLAISGYTYNPNWQYYSESETFTILPAPPSITVTTPSTGAFWQVGTTQNISWESVNVNQDQIIQYSTTGAAPWTNITTLLAVNIVNGTNTYEWIINEPITGINNSSKIRVVSADEAVSGTSSLFTLSDVPQFVVTSPITGNVWNTGLPYDIVFNNNGGNTMVTLYYSIEGLDNWNYCNSWSSTNGENTVQWNIPGYLATQNYVIKVSGNNNTSYSNTFEIVQPGAPAIVSVSPSTGNRGQIITVSITGLNTTFLGSTPNVYFRQQGAPYIYANSVNVVSDLLLEAEFTFYNTYPTGLYGVFVTGTGSSDCSRSSVFTLNPNPNPPIITSVSPSTGIVGQTATLTITGQYTNFEVGLNPYYVWLKQGTSEPIRSNSVTVTDLTSLTAVFNSYNLNAPLGLYDVSVEETMDGIVTKTGGFTLTPPPPSITIDQPTIGKYWQSGVEHQIIWTSTTVASVKIEYSTDNGTTWTNTIETSYPSSNGSNSYPWIPVFTGTENDIKIKITDIASGVFSISPAFILSDLPQFVITQPTSTTQWIAGQEYQVYMQNNGPEVTASCCLILQLRSNVGSTWEAVGIVGLTTVSGQNVYTWPVPISTLAGTTYQISIYDVMNDIRYAKSLPFEILAAPPSITLNQPTGTSYLMSGTQSDITWTSTSVANVNIDFSNDNGLTWTNIESGYVSNNGNNTYTSWTPVVVGTENDARIKITDVVSGVFSESQSFTISSLPVELIVLTPNGGEEWVAGNTYQIQINNQGPELNNAYLYYNDNAGSEFCIDQNSCPIYSIPSGIFTYDWQIPSNMSPLNTYVIGAITYDNNWNPILNDLSDNNFSIVAPAANLTVTSPVSGNFWQSFSMQSISWNCTDNSITSVNIDYSLDGGNTWVSIATNYASVLGNNFYNWPVINVLSTENDARIRVTNASNASIKDVSDLFSIGTASPYITVMQPNGGENLQAGTNYQIKFENGGPLINSVKIELSTDNGQNWTLVENVSNINTGINTYYWNISSAIAGSDYCFVKITDNNNAALNDVSNNVFSITAAAPSLSINSPMSGEWWVSGTDTLISWNSLNVSHVNIYYSIDGGTNWSIIASNIPSPDGNNSWSWTVANVTSMEIDARIKVEDAASNHLLFAQSSFFTINNEPVALTVVSPNGGEVWTAGQTYTIIFNNSGPPTYVYAYISTDNGITWNPNYIGYNSNVAYGSNSISWLVPTNFFPSVNCLIKVVSGSMVDSSDHVFEINNVQPFLSVVEPQVGSLWNMGTHYNITWQSSNLTSVDITYSLDGGTNWETQPIATNVSSPNGQNIFDWHVVDVLNTNTNCKIKITSTTPPIQAESNIFTIVNPSDYCLAGSNIAYNYMSNVSIGAINNTSVLGTGGYEDYTSLSATMQIGENVSATINVTNLYTSDQILIWVDWNKDGDFTDAGENVFTSDITLTNPTIATFAPPVGAAIGTTRMRIRLHLSDVMYNPNNTPCDNSDYGEVEDYTINVTTPCTPPTTQATVFTSSAIADNSMTIGWTRGNGDKVIVVANQGSAVIGNPSSGMTYTADAAFGVGTQIGTGYVVYSGTGTSVNITALNSGTAYHYAVYEYTLSSNCYLTPSLTGNATTTGYCAAGSPATQYEYISNVSIGAINQNSNRGASGYEDYTSQSTILQIGSSVSATITVTEADAPDQILIWIDANHDGDFSDAGENVYSSSGSGFTSPHTATFTPPISAAIGTTVMRIRLNYTGTWPGDYEPNSTPCGYSGYGEVEDYSVNITPCTLPATQATVFAPSLLADNSMTIGWTRGNGDQVIVVANEGVAVSSDPISGTPYTANAAFGSGDQIGTGYVVYSGTGTDVNITNLTAGTTYYYAVYEYSSASNCYLTPALTGNALTTGTLPCTLLSLASNAQNISGSYIDLGSDGSVITTTDFDDANSAAQNIGFTFEYSCESFSEFVLNTNGFIKLGNTPPSTAALFFNGASTADAGIFNSTDPADVYLISPFNHDLMAGTGTPEYRVSTSGTAPDRVCTIQYKNVRDKTTSPLQQYDNMQFQIKLYETSNIIEFVYGDWTPSANASEFKTSACGLKGSGNANDQLLVVNKGSTQAWNAVTFTNANYWSTATLNYGNPTTRPKPDVGRTYRFFPAYNNDLAVREIYTLGEASLNYSNPQTVSVNIKNVGNDNLTNVPVTLTVSGANSFTDTKYIPLLNSGANTLVSFADFNATATGSTSIVVSTPIDDNASNIGVNTKTWVQNTTNNACSYSNTNTPSEAWGDNDKVLYAKYNVTGSANVSSIKAYIYNNAPSIGQTVYGVVMNESGIIVGQSDNYVIQAGDLGGWHTFTINTPPTITDASFYAGFAFTGSDAYYPLGLQSENPLRSDAYFFSNLDGTVLTQQPSYYPYRFMIGANLSAPTAPVAGTASSNSPICSGTSATVTLTGGSGNIQWQQSADGLTNWTNVIGGVGANISNYTTANIAATTYYRAEITQIGFTTLYSNVIEITFSPSVLSTGVISGITTICQNQSSIIYTVPLITNATSYVWTLPNGATGTSTTNSISVNYGTSAASGNVVVAGHNLCGDGPASALPVVVYISPATPILGTITQPTCSVATGSVALSGLQATGTWTLTQSPGGAITTGTGASTTLTGLVAGTFNFTASNAVGCSSLATANVVFTPDAGTPATPILGTITQPTCAVSSGSIELSGLPTGSWTLNPGNISGATTSTTVSNITAGTYNYIVTASGCNSAPVNVVINAQPATPTTPILGTVLQPTCAVATGSIVLSGLPVGNWIINPGNISGYTPTKTISGLPAGTYSYTVTNSAGCSSTATANVIISPYAGTPTTPILGAITQPTCLVSTGSVAMSGLPTGNWILNPGNILGSTTSTTIMSVSAGTYNYIVTNAAGCNSMPTANVVVNTQPATPAVPIVGTITQPTCVVTTGSIELSGLPTGSWTINPGNVSGFTTSTTILNVATGTYNYTVTSAAGCTSTATANVVVNSLPAGPSVPIVGTIIQPTCAVSTGTVELSGLPTGNWTINPGNISGSTTSTTILSVVAGTYNYTVTNAAGCISIASANAVVNPQPATPVAPIVGVVSQPTCAVSTGSVELSGLPTGNWTINPGNISGSTTSTTILSVISGTYNYTVTNAVGCTSIATANVVVDPQPATPVAPVVGVVTQPSCTVSTGSVELSGLPTGSWTINPGSITGSTTSTTILSVATGTYNYTVTNAAGCTSTATANVVVNPQPATPVINLTDATICYDLSETVILDAGNPGLTYLWSDGSNTWSTQQITVDAAVVGVGTHTFYLTVTNGVCEATGSVDVVVDICNSIVSVNENISISMFPNPTKGIVNISMSGISDAEILILNMYGQELINSEFTNVSSGMIKQIDLSSYSKGMYLIKVRSQNYTKIERIVLQ